MSTEFTKIRYSPDRKNAVVSLHFLTEDAGVNGQTKLNFEAAPMPEFIEALRGFRRDLVKVFGFPSGYGHDIEIYQVSISRGERRGIVISGKKSIPAANSPALFHTPWLPEPPEDGGGQGDGFMSSTMIERLDELEAAAQLYLDGKRAQLTLLPDDAGTKQKNNGKRKHSQADIEDAIEGADREAAARIRHREIMRALGEVISAEFPEDMAFRDNEIATILLDEFGDVEFIDSDADTKREEKWPGIFRHALEPVVGQPGYVWCAVRTDAGVPAFWYNVEPELFLKDPGALAATLRGKPLFDAVRELRNLPPDPDAPVTEIPTDPRGSNQIREEPEASGAESPAQFVARTQPANPEVGNYAGVLACAVHRVATGWLDAVESWQDAVREGRSDDHLERMFSTSALLYQKGQHKYGFTVGAGIGDNEAKIEYVSIEVEPLKFTIGKGKKKFFADAPRLVEVLRSVFDIPQPPEDAPSAAASTELEHEPSGAAD